MEENGRRLLTVGSNIEMFTGLFGITLPFPLPLPEKQSDAAQETVFSFCGQFLQQTQDEMVGNHAAVAVQQGGADVWQSGAVAVWPFGRVQLDFQSD